MKNIRKCLDYELKTVIDTLNKKTETLEWFCKDCNNSKKTSIVETMDINVAFDSGYQDIKILLCGYKELNEDLVKKLKNLKDEIKESN